MDSFWDWFWAIFWALVMINLFFGDAIKNAFYTLAGLSDKKSIKPKEFRRLRAEADRAKLELGHANEILRGVQQADKVYPQLPLEVRQNVDDHLADYPATPQLPDRKRKK